MIESYKARKMKTGATQDLRQMIKRYYKRQPGKPAKHSFVLSSQEIGQRLKFVLRIIQQQQKSHSQEDTLELLLRGNNFGISGCQMLIKSTLKHIHVLHIQDNEIGPQGCKVLSKVQWNDLQQLGLSGNRITQKGCIHLSKSKWKSLTRLFLDANCLRDEGCQQLTKNNWQRLEYLNLSKFTLIQKPNICQRMLETDQKSLEQSKMAQIRYFCYENQEQNPIGREGYCFMRPRKWITYCDTPYSRL